VSETAPLIDRAVAVGGLVVVGLLFICSIGTVLGVNGAGQGALATIMGGAMLLGFQAVLDRSPVGIIAGSLLLFSGLAGVVVAVTGGAPFARWPIVGPMALGLALTYYRDRS